MKKITSILFILKILKLLVGILNLSLTAKYFGVSFDKDSWLLSLSLILFLDLAIWGPINETFRSKFIFLRSENGEIYALNKTKSLVFFSFLISFLLICLIFIFPELLANIIAPTYYGVQHDKLVKMILIAAPILLITQFSAIFTSVLNAYESFFIPEIAGFVTSVINYFLLILLVPYIGIYSLIISYYTGAIILFILLYFQLKKLNILLFNFKSVKFSDFKLFFIFALPFFLPYAFGQISAILEKILVVRIGVGDLSALDYSRKFTDIIVNVFTSVLLTILVPILSSKFIEKNHFEFVKFFKEIFQLGMIFLALIIPVFTSSSLSIIIIFFDKGKISYDKLIEISNLSILYSWSLLSIFTYLIFGISLLASNRSKKYAFWGVIAQIITILMNLILINRIGIYIFPVSLLLSHLISGVVMAYNFPYKTKDLITIITKYFFLLILTTIIVFFFNKLMFFKFSFNPFLTICINSIFSLIILILFVVLFDFDERKLINLFYKNFKKKW